MLTDWRTGTRASALADFHLSLTEFDGPFDLLLHLVDKQGFDITSLSLVAVTSQYLAYIDDLKESYTEATSEFLAVGSQLVLLKSRAMLPTGGDPEDEIDEAVRLAERLKVYGAFRKLAHEFDRLQAEDTALFVRLSPHALEPEVAADTGTVDELVAAIHEMLNPTETTRALIPLPTSRFDLPERIATVANRVRAAGKLEFADLARDCRSRLEIIYTLLAVLHLVAQSNVAVRQRKSFGTIEIEDLADD